jgi:hypothetical protein
VTEHDRPLAARRVHDGPRVVHTHLERRQSVLRYAIGESNPALVEDHHARERSQTVQETDDPGLLPKALDVGDPTENEEDVDRAVAEGLVRDVDTVGGLCVARSGPQHVAIFHAVATVSNKPSVEIADPPQLRVCASPTRTRCDALPSRATGIVRVEGVTET